MNLILKSSPFLQGRHIFNPEPENDQAEIARDRGLMFSLSFRGEVAGFTVDPTQNSASALAKLYQTHAAVTSLLAPDPRGLLASRILVRSNLNQAHVHRIQGERMQKRSIRVLAGLISALTGTPLTEVVGISLRPPNSLAEARQSFQSPEAGNAQKVIGYICSWSELAELGVASLENQAKPEAPPFLLMLFVGPSRNIGFESRISDQFLLVGLPTLDYLIEHVREESRLSPVSGIPTIGNILEENALERIRQALSSTLANPYRNDPESWRAQVLKSFIRRPDRGFGYAAAVHQGIAPPILSLMLGRPFGPWRASLNYACVPMGKIAYEFHRVQHFLLGNRGSPSNEAAWVAALPKPVGAGQVSGNQLGEPGIPPLNELISFPAPSSTRSEINETVAKMDRLKRLFGRRYSKTLQNPTSEFLPALNLFCFSDKNLRGKIFPRFVPVPESAAKYLAHPYWRGLPEALPIPERNRPRIEQIHRAGDDPNAGRKSLYSDFLKRNVGDEAISFIFGHGLGLTKSFGPISPVPTLWFINELTPIVEEISRTNGISQEFETLPLPTLRQIQRVTALNASIHQKSDDSDAPIEIAQVDGAVQHLPIPDNDQLMFLKALYRAIQDRWPEFSNKPEEFKKIIFLALTLAGIPLNRLKRLRYYFLGNSLVRSEIDGSLRFHLIVPLPQQDLGLGLVPLHLSPQSAKLIYSLLRTLAAKQMRAFRVKFPKASVAKRRKHLAGFDQRLLFPAFDDQEFRETLRFADRLVSKNRSRKGSKWVEQTLNQGSKFFCRSRFGALIFSSLTGHQITPPNYFSIEDIFFQATGEAVSLRTVTGSPWNNPFVHGASDEKRFRSFRRLLSESKIGRPSAATHPSPLPQMPALDELVLYFSSSSRFPKPAEIKNYLLEKQIFLPRKHPLKGKFSLERETTYSARQIAQELLKRGKLITGRSEHLLWPAQTLRFLELYEQVIQEAEASAADTKSALWWATLILLLGCRANEAPLIQKGHLDHFRRPQIIRVEGTKTDAAPRTVDLLLFMEDSIGAALYQRLFEMGNQEWPTADNLAFPIEDLGFQKKVNEWLNSAYSRLRAELDLSPSSSTFTLTSLRHACAFRVTQEAISRRCWKGTLWIGIASVSQALGHRSMVTTWCSYLGTAMLALRWPAYEDLGPSHCPAISPFVDFMERP